MSVQATSSRPGGKSAGAAGLGALLQLGVFLVVVVAFLVAPLLALAIAFLVYTVMRARGEAKRRSAGSADVPTTGFGSGAQ